MFMSWCLCVSALRLLGYRKLYYVGIEFSYDNDRKRCPSILGSDSQEK